MKNFIKRSSIFYIAVNINSLYSRPSFIGNEKDDEILLKVLYKNYLDPIDIKKANWLIKKDNTEFKQERDKYITVDSFGDINYHYEILS